MSLVNCTVCVVVKQFRSCLVPDLVFSQGSNPGPVDIPNNKPNSTDAFFYKRLIEKCERNF